jgi:MtrB/PioB family decaheme-associated outer membrane protein
MARKHPLALLIGLLLAAPALPAASATTAVADGIGTAGVGYTSQYGNALNPTGWLSPDAPVDPDGVSYLHGGMLRTPTGALYAYPPLLPPAHPIAGSDWSYRGQVQFGWQHVGGDDHALFFQRYAAWSTGWVLGLLDLQFENARTGAYVDVSASRVSDDDDYVRVSAGQYGRYKVSAFYRDVPYLQSTEAHPIWGGIGSERLTLPAGLTPGASTPAQVAAAAAAAPRREIGTKRSTTGLSFEGVLYRNWVGAASVTNEERNGTQLWGGSMFFSDTVETVRPVDATTTDVDLSLRNVGKQWHFLASYEGSFFRNHKDYLSYQSPFALASFSGAALPNPVYQGQWSLEPDNDYHNLRLDLSRSLKWDGSLDLTAGWGTMRQHDALAAPTNCTGLLGTGAYIIPCSDWNTTAALSQRTANARIDTGLLNAKLSFHPTPKFGWHASVRWYREDNKTNYLAYNPLTGQYGYIRDNGAQGTAVAGETGIFQPGNPLYDSAGDVLVRNNPYGYTDKVFELGGDWQLGRRNHLGVTYSFDDNRPRHRERSRVDEQKLKLDWSTRTAGGASLRVSYSYARRTGSSYDYDPYEQFYSASLPGYEELALADPAFTVADMRTYDLSDRTENKAKAILTYPLGQDMTLSGTVYGQWDHYDTRIGRTGTRSSGVNLQWQWLLSTRTNLSVYAGASRSRTSVANVNDADSADNGNALGTPGQVDPNLGGPLFPFANQWWQYDRERDYNAGLTFVHDFGRVRMDMSYAYTYTNSRDGYSYASDGALLYRGDGADAAAGDGFPNDIYKVRTLELGFDFPLTAKAGLRLYGRYERGTFSDYHYADLDALGLSTQRLLYTDLGPEGHYNASVVGVMLNLQL